MTVENLGPAERIISSLIAYTDHAVHNRPGIVTTDTTSHVGVRWEPSTYKVEDGVKVAYKLVKAGKKTNKVRVGTLEGDAVMDGGRKVAEYRNPGLFPEVVAWMYRQVAEVWKLDNEFAAKWASYAYGQDHRDLKVILAAFMLVQSRKGDPVMEDGKLLFYDTDFRDVGEAMILIYNKNKTKDKDTALNPKLLLRIHDVLKLKAVADINRELGFGRSAREAFMGRWPKVVEKWLRFREENPKLLEGLVKAGFRSTVMELARRVGYKPEGDKFFSTLRWKQFQAKDGRRTLAIGQAVEAAESWEGMDEAAICDRIIRTKPSFKRIVGLCPKSVGITRAVMAAAIEAGSLSDKDLIIATPTLEDLGLLQVQEVKNRWETAVRNAEDMRATNIATRVKSKETQEKLQEASDNALKKAVEEVVRGLMVYFIVDISGSMEGAIDAAKSYIAKFLQGFPPDKVKVSVFNTHGREVLVPHPSAAGVQNAFSGVRAGGGTDYGSGVRALMGHKPLPEEDALFIFIGDEGAPVFENAVRSSGINPVAFGLIPTISRQYGRGIAVRDTAKVLRIPCFEISPETFNDPYAIPRTIRAMIAATPVSLNVNVAAPKRESLIELIQKTKLLEKPVWSN